MFPLSLCSIAQVFILRYNLYFLSKLQKPGLTILHEIWQKMHESEKVCSPARQLCHPPCFFFHLCYDKCVQSKHLWTSWGEDELLMFGSSSDVCFI